MDLKPTGNYKIQGDYGEDEVRLRVIDLGTKIVVAEAPAAKVIRRAAPPISQNYAPVIPVFIPRK